MNTAVIGAQWGDEGKAKMVDYLAQLYGSTTSIRYNGGNNAGHTTEDADGTRLAYHLFPASASQQGMVSILARGVVADPEVLIDEIRLIRQRNPSATLMVDPRVHVILPIHKAVDGQMAGVIDLGSTKRGVGPAQADKLYRIGLSYGELVDSMVDDRVREIYAHHGQLEIPSDLLEDIDLWASTLRFMDVVKDTSQWMIRDAVENEGALFAGAHGMALDINSHDYPFVTTSPCSLAGAGTGAGIDPRSITNAIGVLKAYSTRIGTGPFPTEITVPTLVEHIRVKGHEWGSTTGRPRRIGWLDLPQIAESNREIGYDGLALTNLDVLSGLSHVGILPVEGSELHWYPGWTEDITDVRRVDDLPPAAVSLVQGIQDELRTPVRFISVGPKRDQTIEVV